MDFRVCTQCGAVAGGGEAQCLSCGGVVQYADASVFVGRSFGKYELLEVIGRGGMGVVLKGRHVTLDQPVAVKLLLPGLGDPAFGERFLREAKLLAGLRHPNLVEVYDFDIAPGGIPYYVMEFLEGETLAAELARSPQGLGWQRTLAVTRGVVDALTAAHERNVVHRDLKPENIFLTRAGSHERIKLLDFGIARPLDETETHGSLTQTGHVIGTPRYFAPEQFYGYPVSPATDQYALALVVTEMLSGRPLRDAKSLGEVTLDGIGRVVDALTQRLPRGTPAIAHSALERALATDPARRFGSVAEFALALGAATTAPGAAAPLPTRIAPTPSPAATPTRLSKVVSGNWRGKLDGAAGLARQWLAATWTASQRRPLLALGAAAVLSILIGAGLWLRPSPAPTPPAAADPGPAESGQAPASAAATPATPSQWLQERGVVNTPIDARAILARVNDIVVLEAANGWYLLRLGSNAAPTRVDMPAGRRLLGALEGGSLAVREGEKLLAVDPVTGDSRTLAQLPAQATSETLLWLAPDARTLVIAQADGMHVYRVAGQGLHELATLADTVDLRTVAVSREWIAIATRGAARMRVYRTSDAEQVLDQPLDAGQVRDLRVLDMPARVAVASTGPEIHVFALDESAPRRSFSLQGGAQALAWVADYPTLLLAGESGVSMWRDAALLDERHADARLERGNAFADGHGVLVLDSSGHTLRQFDYGNLPIAASHDVGKSEAWALHVDPDADAIYLGSRDGVIRVLRQGKLGEYKLHADGVTALVGDDKHLASASDDRTLAIWSLPGMTVQWRSRGHDFLVNQLQLQGNSLWSSSSDGTLKRWHWPTLEAEDSIDVRALSGRTWSLHAFNVDASATHALVGTWNNAVLALEREPAKPWQMQVFPVDSSGGYHVLDLPKVGLQVVQGIGPTRMFVYDTQARALYDLPDFGADFSGLSPDGSGNGALAVGTGVVARYVLMRDPNGSPRWAASLAMRSDLHALGASDYDARRHLLWVGSGDGKLYALDTETLRLPPPRIGPARVRAPAR